MWRCRRIAIEITCADQSYDVFETVKNVPYTCVYVCLGDTVVNLGKEQVSI